MVAKSQVKVEVCLEVAEVEDGEECGDGEEAGAGGRCGAGGAGRLHGPTGFRLRAFLLLNLDPFSFLHPIDVGPGYTYQGSFSMGSHLTVGHLHESHFAIDECSFSKIRLIFSSFTAFT